MLNTRRARGSTRRVLPAAALLALAACGEDRSLEPHAQAVYSVVLDTLAAHGVCASLPQCRTGEFAFWDPGSKAVYLSVYGVRSEGTVAALRGACARYVATTAGALRSSSGCTTRRSGRRCAAPSSAPSPGGE